MAVVLVIDDSDSQRAKIRATLEESGVFTTILEASDGLLGLKALLGEPVDLVLCDLEMPGLDGEKLLRVKDQSPGGDNIPFLFLTASTDVERKVRLLEDGACDTISKPFHSADLVARLRLHLKVKQLQDELMIKNASLERLSTVDSLTGLRNRRFAYEALSIEYLRARRYRTPLSLLMADLDHFKSVNDRYGHPGGDAVLTGVSELLLNALRATDIAGRYGGEELIVLLPQNDLDGAVAMAERWRQSVENASFPLPDGRCATATVSIGVASYCDGFETPDEFVAAADSVLYIAKQKGRNRVEVYDAGPD